MWVVYDIAFLTFNVYKHSIQYTIVIGCYRIYKFSSKCIGFSRVAIVLGGIISQAPLAVPMKVTSAAAPQE